jgi:hypothetical protein
MEKKLHREWNGGNIRMWSQIEGIEYMKVFLLHISCGEFYGFVPYQQAFCTFEVGKRYKRTWRFYILFSILGL